MRRPAELATATLVAMLCCAASGIVQAQDYQAPPRMQAWVASTEHQGVIAPATRITMRNWKTYKNFMPLGMQDLFEGKYFWKMPPDVEINVRATKVYPLPAGYVAAS